MNDQTGSTQDHEQGRPELSWVRMRIQLLLRAHVTLAIATVCTLMFSLQVWWSGGDLRMALVRMGAGSALAIESGQVWRLGSSMFLHWDREHYVGNMLTLLIVGPALEVLLGKPRYLFLYLAAGMAGSALSALLQNGLSAGASGAIWGLLLAWLALLLWLRYLRGPELASVLDWDLPASLGLLALNLINTFQPGINWRAHAGGALVGLLLVGSGILVRRPAAGRRAGGELGNRLFAVGAAVLSLVVGGALITASVRGRPWELVARPELQRMTVSDAVSIELPVPITRRVDKEYDDRVFYGVPLEDPMAVEIVVHRIPPEREIDLAPDMESLREEFFRESPNLPRGVLTRALYWAGSPDYHPGRSGAPVGHATIQMIEGRPLATGAFEESKMRIESWRTILDRHLITVRIYSLPTRSPNWRDLDQRVVASLRVDPRPERN